MTQGRLYLYFRCYTYKVAACLTIGRWLSSWHRRVCSPQTSWLGRPWMWDLVSLFFRWIQGHWLQLFLRLARISRESWLGQWRGWQWEYQTQYDRHTCPRDPISFWSAQPGLSELFISFLGQFQQYLDRLFLEILI